MSVFISYRHTNVSAAQYIYLELIQNGIPAYMDKFDAESQTTDNITEVITRRIADCTHLLAVMSADTIASWWVPFEIGEATALSRRITSYRLGYTELPEYLHEWPVMSNSQHLQMFIEEYKREVSLKPMFESRSSVPVEKSARRQDARDFHDMLKARIRRGG